MKYIYNYDDNEGKKNTTRKTNSWYEKNIKFCEKKMMMREINKWNLKTMNEKETHQIWATYIAFYNWKQFVFLEKIKRKALGD